MKSRVKLAGQPWVKVSFNAIVENLHYAPPRQRWRWHKVRGREAPLIMKSDRSLWLFKLNRGAWIKRYESRT